MATEKAIQTNIIKYLRSIGAYVVNHTATKAGVPDLLICFRGDFLAIEVKHPDKKYNVSPLQEHNLQLIEDTGGEAFVAWDVKQVKMFMEERYEISTC